MFTLRNCSWIALIILLLVGCMAPTAGQPSEAPDSGSDSSLRFGADGPEVLELRSYLTRFGYFPNDDLAARFPDWQPMLPAAPGDAASFDEGLETALMKYQRNMGLTETGELDAATQAAMDAPRCGNPDHDPDAANALVEKWAHYGPSNRWNKTSIKYKINQPNVTLQGMGTAAATKAAIKAGIQLWHAATNLTFTEVTSGEDFIVDYMNLGASPTAWGTPPPSPAMMINSAWVFTPLTLVITAAHEVGHIIGLHHSSNHVVGVTTPPLMYPSGNSNAILTNDDRVAANVLYNSWERMPGLAYDIGVSVNNQVWILGQGARQPYRWNGSAWELVSLGRTGSRIDVDSWGRPWVVDSANVIHRYDGVSWAVVPGNGRAIDIGIGRTDQVFATGTDGRIYKYVNNGWSFWGGPSGSTSIDVDMAGIPHVIGSNNAILACPNSNCVQVGGGLGLDIGFGGPDFYTFGTENWGWAIGLSDTIWARNKQGAINSANPGSAAPAVDGWVQTSGAARRISVNPNGGAWIVASNGNIYRRRELP